MGELTAKLQLYQDQIQSGTNISLPKIFLFPRRDMFPGGYTTSAECHALYLNTWNHQSPSITKYQSHKNEIAEAPSVHSKHVRTIKDLQPDLYNQHLVLHNPMSFTVL